MKGRPLAAQTLPAEIPAEATHRGPTRFLPGRRARASAQAAALPAAKASPPAPNKATANSAGTEARVINQPYYKTAHQGLSQNSKFLSK